VEPSMWTDLVLAVTTELLIVTESVEDPSMWIDLVLAVTTELLTVIEDVVAILL